MDTSRRAFLRGAVALAFAAGRARADTAARPIQLILAPSNLGLSPPASNVEPGTWQAPATLAAAGLAAAVRARGITSLPRPHYQAGAQAGTRIRNGHTLRLDLAATVRAALAKSAFPLVIGGDCSLLLGGLYATRLSGGRGLVHVDGHSDFFHSLVEDASGRLGAVAGMDLALATGRGEPLLTQWPGIAGPLVADPDAIQIGESNASIPGFANYYRGLDRTAITRLMIQDVERVGIVRASHMVIERLQARQLEKAWLHVDLDVIDQAQMPAVDSPGTPGLSFTELAELLAAVYASGRIAGATVSNYDPSRDPQAQCVRPIVNTLGHAFR
ncbi:MAG: arginase family protein [Steroidobacteraceae bacterium]